MSGAPTAAVVVDDPGLGPVERLSAALDRIGAWRVMAAARQAAGVPAEDLPVVILPELGAFAVGSPAAVDPALVEALVDLLHDAGYTSVTVAGGADGSERWAANRNVYALAELLGYRYETDRSREYDVVDLTDDLVPAPFRPGAALARTHLSRTWVEAGARIVFAANVTDEADGYALGVHTALRALPVPRDDYVYSYGVDPADLAAELLSVTPVHLTLIDALVSGHGSGGRRAPKPLVTDCLIAATDIWLADTVGAIKMGLDPSASPLAARAPQIHDSALESVIDGDLDVYEGWVSPDPHLLASARRRDTSPWWSRLVRPWLQVLDPGLFPLESPLDARLNARLAHWFADIDDDPLAMAAMVFVNQTMGSMQQLIDGYRVLYAKDDVRRIAAPLGFDPMSFDPDAYASMVAELRSLQHLLGAAPEWRPGLRWRRVDRAVLFDYRREIPIDFDEFVAAVDVARSISYMNDYIGGVVVPVEEDAAGRPVRQAERNLYLPQPNYLVLSGGEPIDVGKIEVVEYDDGLHRMYWKTIRSENGSAEYDDGIVTFERSDVGTAVTIFGRQLFVLPPLWQAIDRELDPRLRDRLVTDAYATFFDRTLANLEALVEGRDIRIGRTPPEGDSAEPLPVATVERLVEDAMAWLDQVSATVRGDDADDTPPAATRGRVDADGFTHFQASQAAEPHARRSAPVAEGPLGFWAGLVRAGLRDLGARVGGDRQ